MLSEKQQLLFNSSAKLSEGKKKFVEHGKKENNERERERKNEPSISQTRVSRGYRMMWHITSSTNVSKLIAIHEKVAFICLVLWWCVYVLCFMHL